jgi:hypothetical protein
MDMACRVLYDYSCDELLVEEAFWNVLFDSCDFILYTHFCWLGKIIFPWRCAMHIFSSNYSFRSLFSFCSTVRSVIGFKRRSRCLYNMSRFSDCYPREGFGAGRLWRR